MTAAAPATLRLLISGMDCADCARTVEASLGTMQGVSGASVSFAAGRADVTYDDDLVTPEQIADRVRALGYVPAPPAPTTVTWTISGMDCADCARTVERTVANLPGVASAAVNFGAATLVVEPAGAALPAAAIEDAVRAAGYRATPRGAVPAPPVPWWRRRRTIEVIASMVLWVVGFTLEHRGAPTLQYAVPYLLAMVLAGYPVARSGWYALQARRADMNLLMTIAAVGAVAIGEWGEGSSVLILFAVGLALQSATVERTRRQVAALLQVAPQTATLVRGGDEVTVPVGAVPIGAEVLVRPGERVPVDGIVLAGRSAVDQAAITGESVPAPVEPGDEVFAGSINGDGALRVTASRPASDSTVARMVHLVEEAQGSRAPAQAMIDRFAAWYTPLVVGIALVLAIGGGALTGDWHGWIYRALVLLVVACPCALVISTPVALVAAIGSSSRRGILFKGGAAIESLASVGAVAFDKTGTLTEGRPAVIRVIPLEGIAPDHALARAAAVEREASHPIARGIVSAAAERGLALPPVSDAETIPGLGARGQVDGEVVLAGSPRLFAPLPDRVATLLEEIGEDGTTVVLVGSPGNPQAILTLADQVRPESAAAVEELRDLGVKTVMLTGDNPATAARIAAQVGVDRVEAGLLPGEKVREVALLEESSPVAMVGDGINDAPALARATTGIAMGLAGSDVAIETADVALMGDDLASVPAAIRVARDTVAIIRQNVIFAIAIKAVFVALTMAGLTNLWLAVLADMGASLLVTFNALRLTRNR